jgi:hypothetical protein
MVEDTPDATADQTAVEAQYDSLTRLRLSTEYNDVSGADAELVRNRRTEFADGVIDRKLAHFNPVRRRNVPGDGYTIYAGTPTSRHERYIKETGSRTTEFYGCSLDDCHDIWRALDANPFLVDTYEGGLDSKETYPPAVREQWDAIRFGETVVPVDAEGHIVDSLDNAETVLMSAITLPVVASKPATLFTDVDGDITATDDLLDHLIPGDLTVEQLRETHDDA